jgi:hypothetical protein
MRKIADSLDINYFDLNVKAGYVESDEWANWGLKQLEKPLSKQEDSESFKAIIRKLSDQIDKISTNESFQMKGGGEKSVSVEEIFNKNGALTYNNRLLSTEDRQRILDMMALMFPE